MTVTDVIAWLAFGAAALSALYARWAVQAANRANRLSVQTERVEIYRTLLDFGRHFHGLFAHPVEGDLDLFKRKVVVLAELYFPPAIYEALDTFHKDCWNSWYSIAELEFQNDDARRGELMQMKQGFKRLHERMGPIADMMKSELKVHDV